MMDTAATFLATASMRGTELRPFWSTAKAARLSPKARLLVSHDARVLERCR